MIKLSDEEYILVTFQDTRGEIAAFRKSYFNIYLVNPKEETIKKINSGIGEIDIVFMGEEELGKIITTSSKIVFNENAGKFTLKEIRSKKMTDSNAYDSYTPYDTVATNYF